MKAGGGRAKGASFERHVAGMIVKAFAHKGITKADCYRTPLSGGHRFAKASDPGDLVMSPALQKLFNYSVEAKSYRKLDWHKLFTLDKGHWSAWWTQCCKAATEGKKPLLVFRQNRSEVFCLLSKCDGPRLIPCMKLSMGKIQVTVIRFDAFLRRCSDV